MGPGSWPTHCLTLPPCYASIYLQYLLSTYFRLGAGGFCLCYSSKGNESSPGYSDKSNNSSQGQTGAWEQKGMWPLPLNFKLLLQEGSGREQGIGPVPQQQLLTSCPLVPPMGTLWSPAPPQSFSWAPGGGLHRSACK